MSYAGAVKSEDLSAPMAAAAPFSIVEIIAYCPLLL